MATPEVAVIRTGTANLASVLAGFRRIGASPRIVEDSGSIESARLAVLPGVGAFGAAMEKIRSEGLEEAIRARVLSGLPTLAVCLGLQVLCECSEESPGVKGLSILPVKVGRFSGGVRIPQLGWNTVEPDPACGLLRPGHAYYANSYRITTVPDGWHGAFTTHGERFVGALEKGAVLACQFHPELSGTWGLGLLKRWLEKGLEGP
jgi:imidazole glycerol-phosphate synthase subunit HisH